MKILFIALIFIAAFLLVLAVYGLLTGKRSRVTARVRRMVVEPAEAVKEEAAAAEAGLPVRGRSQQRYILLDGYFQSLGKRLAAAGVLFRPQEFFLISLFLALLVILLLYLMKANLLLVLAAGAAAYFLPLVFLNTLHAKRRRIMNSQVGDMVLLLSNYLRAGHGFVQAMEMVSREMLPPLADELKRFIKDTTLGVSLEEALADLERRTADDDLAMVITAIQIQHQVGGNLAEVLDNINHTIRERIRLKGEVRTLTAQGRLTAIVLCGLPVFVGFMISIVSPQLLSVLFTERAGQFMLMGAVAAQLAGILVIRRIVRVDI